MDFLGYLLTILCASLFAFLIGMFVAHCMRSKKDSEIIIKKLDAIMKKMIFSEDDMK